MKPEQPSPKRRRTSANESFVAFNGNSYENGAVDNEGRISSMPKLRGYQEEMLAESLRRNVIIAMDTGSGKTQIAIRRIQEELLRCPKDKLVWFTAPTVVLAQQQHAVIEQQLPAFQTRMLSGADNVDHWKSQKIWDDVLYNIRIVVSTPQVLLDVMENGFFSINRISLLVFDEAHHCVRSSAQNTIMQNFYYHKYHQQGTKDGLPHIMGLTASPIANKPSETSKLEENLDAICKTPRVHRDELMQYVHPPQLWTAFYQEDEGKYSQVLESLDLIIECLDIEQDPFVIRFKKRDDVKSQAKLAEAISKRKTPCLMQLKRLLNRATVIQTELGTWATNTFLVACVDRLRRKVSSDSWSYLSDWDRDDDTYMLGALSKLQIDPVRYSWDSEPRDPNDISQKFASLVQILETERSPEFTGIVFAKERSTVLMLSHLLSKHPQTRHIFPGPFVGESGGKGQTGDISELNSTREQKYSVSDLRTGKKNLLVATSVLEEGIDVSACYLVVCYDPLVSLRSFIQRRGRARKKGSKFVLFILESDQIAQKNWAEMEKRMKEEYEREERELAEIWERESIVEVGYPGRRIELTGAFLTLENARPHLEHFCATLKCDFMYSRPDFFITKHGDNRYSAKVLLPGSLDPQFREFQGAAIWQTMKMARRDAAFQACSKLYDAGFINNHLMPVHNERPEINPEQIEKRASLATVSGLWNPWRNIATQWLQAKSFYQTVIEITSVSQLLPQMRLILPIPLPCNISFKVFWNEETTITIHLKPQEKTFATGLVQLAATATHILLSSLFSARMAKDCLDYCCLFLPEIQLTADSIADWCQSVIGTIPASSVDFSSPDQFVHMGLVRGLGRLMRPWTIEKCLWMRIQPEDGYLVDAEAIQDVEDAEELHIEGTLWPKSSDFLHPVANSNSGTLHHTARTCYPAKNCSIDKLPVKYSRFALFIPHIIHKIEIFLVADELSKTILAPVGFKDLNLVVTAISASSAREASDYQRLEFLGDSLLKLHASMHLSATKPLWHEGLLSVNKDRIVSNTRLAKAAIQAGLDRFILLKPFTGQKWRPTYNADHVKEAPGGVSQRKISTKVLADVIEALFGAAMVDGGADKAVKCLKVFLPECQWMPLVNRVQDLYDAVPPSLELADNEYIRSLEELIGHKFLNKYLLAQAFTHPSRCGAAMSYERLEFIGDSILDSIIVKALFESPKEFPQNDMHLMRTALANADFLAFLCMSTFTEEARGEVHNKNGEFATTMTTTKTYLWKFMKHSASLDIVDAQQEAMKQYELLDDDISTALCSSNTYPWALLSRLCAQKFFSDLIESILGAIFIDSHGSFEDCTAFLDRIGLTSYLQHLLTEDITIMHPKERLGIEAGNRKVRYETDITSDETGSSRKFECRVLVDEEEVARIEDGVSRIEAETTAAEAALDVLRGQINTGHVGNAVNMDICE